MKQNIYDHDKFFNNYREQRNKNSSANNLYESPCIEALLPEVYDFDVLDMGCGSGDLSAKIARMGAKSVLGIDISVNQIVLAQSLHKKNQANLSFEHVAIEDFVNKSYQFNLVVSSMALHYIMDYTDLIKKIKLLLKKNGCLLFSIEHPMVTCYPQRYESKMAALRKYRMEGKRIVEWHEAKVIKYHRTLETLTNTLIRNGFIIESIYEPCPLPTIIVFKSSLRN